MKNLFLGAMLFAGSSLCFANSSVEAPLKSIDLSMIEVDVENQVPPTGCLRCVRSEETTIQDGEATTTVIQYCYEVKCL